MGRRPAAMTDLDVLMACIDISDSCWLWTGSLTNGYGRVSFRGQKIVAHKAMWLIVRGDIPDGLELDHLCHGADPTCRGGVTCQHRRCVNPDHLEPVTRRENVLRGLSPAAKYGARSACAAGHALDDENAVPRADSGRRCRKCDELNARQRRPRNSTRGFIGPINEPAVEHEILAANAAVREEGANSARRLQAVLRLIELLGSQYEAGRRLGLHQSTISKLLTRARAQGGAVDPVLLPRTPRRRG